MKLYSLRGGPYPKRTTIYVAEKGITTVEVINVVPRFMNKGAEYPPPALLKINPAGTFPTLDAGDGTVVRQSLAILDDLEERFPAPNMIGRTPAARAATREMIATFDEATTLFGIWARYGSRFAATMFKPRPDAAAAGAERYAIKLRFAESSMADTAFLAGESVSMADCVAMALLQFADTFYGVSIPTDCPKLAAWYQRFSQRPSCPPDEMPPEVLAMSRGLCEQTQCFL